MMNFPKPSPPKPREMPLETQNFIDDIRRVTQEIQEDSMPAELLVMSEYQKNMKMLAAVLSDDKATLRTPAPKRRKPLVIRDHLTQSLHDNPDLQALKAKLEEPKQPIKRNPRRKTSTRKATEKN